MRACDGRSSARQHWRSLAAVEPRQPVLQLANLIPTDLSSPALAPPQPRSPRLVVASGTSAHKQIWIEELAPALAKLLGRALSCGWSAWRAAAAGVLPSLSASASTLQRLRHPCAAAGGGRHRLAALEPGLHTDAKSVIRWMEFSLGLASVLSPTATYTELLEDGVHARFARGTEQWVEAAEQLLADPAARRAMAGGPSSTPSSCSGPIEPSGAL